MSNPLSYSKMYLQNIKLPHIPNALENISATCKAKLDRLYPAGIPIPVSERYNHEYEYLKISEYIDDFELFRLFSKESQKNATFFSSKFTTASSLIYFLLSNNDINPLPPHYYCPHCGFYEEGPAHSFGIDLPIKKCPHCGTELYASGFNLPLENVWGIDGKKAIEFQYTTSREFLPFAYRLLVSTYPNNEIVPWGNFRTTPSNQNTTSYSGIIGIDPIGFIILPENKHITDYPNLISSFSDGTPCILGDFLRLSDLFLKKIVIIPDNYMEKLLQLQRATGLYINEITEKELRNIGWNKMYNAAVLNPKMNEFVSNSIPRNFHDITNVIARQHNSYIWSQSDDSDNVNFNLRELEKTNSFQEFPCYTREDFFEYLLSHGIERSLAFTASEYARKGYGTSSLNLKKFDSLPVSNSFKKIAHNFKYATSRIDAIHQSLIFARLAYYAKVERRVYSKIMFDN